MVFEQQIQGLDPVLQLYYMCKQCYYLEFFPDPSLCGSICIFLYQFMSRFGQSLNCLPTFELTGTKISRCNYSRDLATTKSGDEEYVQTGENIHVVSEADEQNGCVKGA